jgi:hypothetical protein
MRGCPHGEERARPSLTRLLTMRAVLIEHHRIVGRSPQRRTSAAKASGARMLWNIGISFGRAKAASTLATVRSTRLAVACKIGAAVDKLRIEPVELGVDLGTALCRRPRPDLHRRPPHQVPREAMPARGSLEHSRLHEVRIVWQHLGEGETPNMHSGNFVLRLSISLASPASFSGARLRARSSACLSAQSMMTLLP